MIWSLLYGVCALSVLAVTAEELNIGFYNGTDPVPFPSTSSKKSLIDSHIIGGYDADILNFPFQVSIRINGNHNCGGSIISTQWVLTAAHCMNFPLSVTTFYFGSANKLTGGILRNASIKTIHPQYGSLTSNHLDVGVYKLTTALVFTNKIKAITLPVAGQIVLPGSLTWVSGWGTNSTTSYTSPNNLQAVIVPTVPWSICWLSYGNNLTWSMCCAGYLLGGFDSCQGDSGGPMVGYVGLSLQLFGIVSWGTGCAQPGYYGVYTFVPSVRDWIKQTTGV